MGFGRVPTCPRLEGGDGVHRHGVSARAHVASVIFARHAHATRGARRGAHGPRSFRLDLRGAAGVREDHDLPSVHPGAARAGCGRIECSVSSRWTSPRLRLRDASLVVPEKQACALRRWSHRAASFCFAPSRITAAHDSPFTGETRRRCRLCDGGESPRRSGRSVRSSCARRGSH